MQMVLIFTIVMVFALLLASEIWWRKRSVHGEISRKFVHISVGSFVAFWPYFLSNTDIKLLSLAFIVVVAFSKYFRIFQSIHSVQRPTWGEFLFAASVGLLAFATHHHHIYTVALLEMSLADGLAAVVGTRYGANYRYIVFGSPKSVVGSLTFFVVSCLLLSGYSVVTMGILMSPLVLLLIAAGATLIENIAVRGFDNLLVPLFVAAILFFYP